MCFFDLLFPHWSGDCLALLFLECLFYLVVRRCSLFLLLFGLRLLQLLSFVSLTLRMLSIGVLAPPRMSKVFPSRGGSVVIP